MKQIRLNLLTCFAATGWAAVIGLAFVPLYIRFLGIEAYGLVGLYLTIQAITTIVDLGLSTTLNRELARLSAQPDQAQKAYDLVRSLEVCYWGIAALVGASVIGAAPFIADHWVQASQIPPATVRLAIMCMGGLLLFQFPLTFYSGGMMGLQQQVALNGINTVMSTLRSGGVVLILWLVSPSIISFFSWQVGVGAIHTGIMAGALWRSLPKAPQRPQIRFILLREVWRFAAGMSGITVVSILLTQVDSVILSRLLPLEQFGYYSLAGMVANGLYSLIGPIFTVFFPSFTRLVTLHDDVELRRLYHQSCQFMSVVILPVTIVIAFFSYEILLLWTGNQRMAETTHLLVSLLVIGTALNGLMNLPGALQLAYGWTSLTFYQNLISVFILVPLTIWATLTYGAVGAAVIWISLNASYILIGIQIMHTRLLKGEKLAWYLQDVGLPLLITLGTVLLIRIAVPAHMQPVAVLLLLGGT
ncbi:MAG: oligosaccharide flippase family protein, partial [Chloroflexales bacterium]